MIKVTRTKPITAFPDHTEHYSGRGNTVAVRQANIDERGIKTYNITVGAKGYIPTTLYNLNKPDALSLVNTVCILGDIEEDTFVDVYINQAWRECYIVKVNPKRVRLEYELPNTGLVGGWYPLITIGTRKFISYYRDATL